MNNIYRSDTLLSTGRLVRHTRLPSGADQADMVDGGEMTEAEWEEYCAIVVREASRPRFWLWEGTILRAAQSTFAGAIHYWKPGWHVTSTPSP